MAQRDRYDHQAIEKAAQEKWAALDLYKTDLASGKDPYYLLVEFPYPSGDLHIGHWYAFALPDMYARYLRMQGKEVLFPIGFDAFGLPAENAAIKHGVDPAAWTNGNIERMRGQLRSMGASFDWSREIAACDPDYYRWTQWLFLKLYEHGLAVRKKAPVKWCPHDKTVLANEQVIDGHCERCGAEVEERELTQWFLKITDYADRLLADLEPLPWREEIKDAQRAWIGKSEGAKLRFALKDHEGAIEVFTTRPDTVFGVTYVVLAPEHPLVGRLLEMVPNKAAVAAYLEATKKKTERERSENKDKSGVALEDVMAINPATKEAVPVYVADYVLGSYGTGAVMAVPAHDERDFEFARKNGLPVKQVIAQRFVQSTGPGTFREGEPVQEKDGVIVFVRHWDEDKYIALKWKQVDWGTLLTGTVDEGVTPEETVLKEIQEETGYQKPIIVGKLGVVDGIFYHDPKKTNKHVHGHIYVAQLEDGERAALDADEDAKHEVKWLTLGEMDGFLTADTHKQALAWLRDGYKPYTGTGSLVDSGPFTGRISSEAAADIVALAGGEMTTQYRLRDLLVSRQRYWGCPIPVVYDPQGAPHPVPADHLPWLLPNDVDFAPGGAASPLASSKELNERVTKLFGEGWTPEYDTLDTFVDSSWYYTRYLDPKDEHDFSDQALMKKWLPVDRYSGGSEHTTMHLLYARFFYKALHDLALTPTKEPFNERFNRGIILGPDGQKMSKSKGNVVNPDDFVQKYGADAVRLYLAFIGPYNEPGSYPWTLEGAASMRKFLDRINTLVTAETTGVMTPGVARACARAIAKVAADTERFKLNTAVSALMVLVRDLEKLDSAPLAAKKDLVRLLAPFAPHLAEHLWQTLDPEAGSVHAAAWPAYDHALLEGETSTVAVQVNGKRRGDVALAPDASEADALAAALALPAVSAALHGAKPSRVVYVPGRILNLVVANSQKREGEEQDTAAGKS